LLTPFPIDLKPAHRRGQQIEKSAGLAIVNSDTAFAQDIILDAVEMAVFVLEVGQDGLPRYLSMNKKARAITGKTPEDVVGKTAMEIFDAPTGEQALYRHLTALHRNDELTYEVTLPLAQKTVYLRTTIRPIRNDAEEVTHLVGTSLDITSERERDSALELSKLAQEKAEEASKAKERFLANMSHEIRTPMNGILGMCELLVETDLDDQQGLFAATIYNSADALLNLVNDVLDFSKIQADKISIHQAPFSLRSLISDLDQLMRSRARS
jgi:PAS domain S-box-containing protein